MATQKNATYKVDNGTDFDEIHFKTNTEQVVGLKSYTEFTPTLLAGWVDMDGNIRCKYWKDSIGQVHIIGAITGGANESVPFWLPEGYKPARRMDFVCIQQYEEDGPARVRIRADGAIVIYKSSRSAYIDFGEIIFQL